VRIEVSRRIARGIYRIMDFRLDIQVGIATSEGGRLNIIALTVY